MIHTIGYYPDKFHQVMRNGYFPTCLVRTHFTDYLLSGMWPVSSPVTGNFGTTGYFPQFICDKNIRKSRFSLHFICHLIVLKNIGLECYQELEGHRHLSSNEIIFPRMMSIKTFPFIHLRFKVFTTDDIDSLH